MYYYLCIIIFIFKIIIIIIIIIIEIFDKFCNQRNGDGIASIISKIPKETIYTELICYGFKRLLLLLSELLLLLSELLLSQHY